MMGFLYKLSRGKDSFGEIRKYEGHVELFRKRFTASYGPYDDYCFVSEKPQKKVEYLTTWNKPTDGMVSDRTVYLEKEDDKRALRLIAESIEKDIEKTEARKNKLVTLRKSLHMEQEGK